MLDRTKATGSLDDLDVRHFGNHGTQTNRVSMVCDVRTLQRFVKERLEGRHLGELSVLRADLTLNSSSQNTREPPGEHTSSPPLPAGVLTLEVRDAKERWGVVGVSFGVGCDRVLSLNRVQVTSLGPAAISGPEVLRDIVAHFHPHVDRAGGFMFPLDVLSGVLRSLFVSAGWRAPSSRGLSLCALRVDLRTITLNFDRHRPPFVASSQPPLPASLATELEHIRAQLRDGGRTRELLEQMERVEAWLSNSPPLIAACARWRAELARGIDDDLRLRALQIWKKHEVVPTNDRAVRSMLIASLAKRGDPRHTLPLLPLPSRKTAEPHAYARIRIARAKVLLTRSDDARDALSLVVPLEEPPLWDRLHPIVRLEAAVTIAQARISIHATEATGHPALAMEALERALAEVPSPSLRCRALLELVLSLEFVEDYELSLKLAERALRESPDDIDVMDAILRLAPTTTDEGKIVPLLERRMHEHLGSAEQPTALQRVIDVAQRVGGTRAITVAQTAAVLLAQIADDASSYRAAAQIAEKIGSPHEVLEALRMAHERGAAAGTWTDSVTYIGRLHHTDSHAQSLDVFFDLRAQFELPRNVEAELLAILLSADPQERHGELLELTIKCADGEQLARALVARAKLRSRTTERLADIRAALEAAPTLIEAITALMQATDDTDRQGLRRLIEHLTLHGAEDQIQETRLRLVQAANALGDAEEARQTLETMLYAAPQDRAILLMLARQLETQERASDLLALALPRLKTPAPTPTDLELCCLAAGALSQRGDPAESARVIARWRVAGGAFGEVEVALQRRAMSLEFEGTLASGNVERAVAFAQHAMDMGTEEAPRWLLRAAQHASGATRITTLRKLVAVRPEDPRALNALEDALRQVDDNAGLVALLEHRATTGTVLDRLTALRSLASMMPNTAGTEDDRRSLVERIHALDPTDPESLTSLASMERDTGRRRDLWERLAQVVARDDPRQALALCELAAAAAAEGEAERARSILDTLLSNDPSHERGLALALQIAPALDDPDWTRRCALGILAAGRGEISQPSLNLTLARACVDIERFDEALVASGRAATTASAGSDLHIDASRLWAELARPHGSATEHRRSTRERRRAVGTRLTVEELLEELVLYEVSSESRDEAVGFVCQALSSWRLPLALAAANWIAALETGDTTEGTARTKALSAVATTIHDEALRNILVETALTLARASEQPDTVLQLLDDVELTTWSDASVELRRWALARAGRREHEVRRLERSILDPDTPLQASTMYRFEACFDGEAELLDALCRLTRLATPDRAAQLARQALDQFSGLIGDEKFLVLLETLADCSMTAPGDWSSFSERVAAQGSAELVVRSIALAQRARKIDPRSGAPAPRKLTEDALARFPDHAPLYEQFIEGQLGAREINTTDVDGIVSRIDNMAQRGELDDETHARLFERTAAALSSAAGSALVLQKARRCVVGTPLRAALEATLVSRSAWRERCELLEADHDEQGASPWIALLAEADGHATGEVLSRIQWCTSRSLLDEQRDSEAIAVLALVAEATPPIDEAILELGMAYARTGQLVDASRQLGALALRDPFPSTLGMTRCELANKCGGLSEQVNDSAEALRWYQVAREHAEHGASDWIETMDAIFRLRASVDEGIAAAEIAREVVDSLAPESPLALRWIRRFIEAGGPPFEAMIERGLSLKPSDPLIVNAAMSRFQRAGNHGELIRTLKNALENWDGPPHEHTPTAWRATLATLYVDHVGDEEAFVEAERLWRESIRKAPLEQEPLHGLGDLLERRDRPDEALELRARAAALEPTHPRNAPTIISRTLALATKAPTQAMRWVTFGVEAELRHPEFLDACLRVADAVNDADLKQKIWEAQCETTALPALTRAQAALALGRGALEHDRAEGMRRLELASTLARAAAPRSETHRAAATAWLGALLDPRAEPSSPAIEARARAMQRAAMGDELSPAAWRAEIDLLAGPLREPDAALALAHDSVVAQPNEEQLVTRLTTLATEIGGETMAVEQLKRAAITASYHEGERSAALRTLAQVARSAGMPPEARWALDQMSRDSPMPAGMINIHAWTLRQLGGVDEEVVRVLRGCTADTASSAFENLLHLFEDSTERTSQSILERLSLAPPEARLGILRAAVESCVRTPASSGAVLAPLLAECLAFDASVELGWAALAEIQDIPDATHAEVARALLASTDPAAAVAAIELCSRSLRGSARKDALELLAQAATSVQPERGMTIVVERLEEIVREVGPHSVHARDLCLLGASVLPNAPLQGVLAEVLGAHANRDNPTERLLEAMNARGYASEILDFYTTRQDIPAENLAATADLAAQTGDLETEVLARREAAARLVASQHVDAARTQLQKALIASPDDWRSCQALVDVYDITHEWGAAFEQMAPLLTQFPEDPAHLRRAGSYARKSNRLRACVDLWNEALSLYSEEDPSDDATTEWLVLAEELHQVLVALELRVEATELALRIARRRDGDSSIEWSIHAAHTASPEDASELLEDALLRAPASLETLDYLERALHELPSPTLLHELWRRRLQPDGLAPFTDSAIAAEKSIVLLDVGDEDEARADQLLEIVVGVPGVAQARHHAHYAALMQANGRSALAETHWHFTAQLTASLEDLPHAELHLLAAARHASFAATPTESIERWKAVRRAHPDAPMPHRALLSLSRDAEDAQGIAQSGTALLKLEAGPASPEILAPVGRAALESGMHEPACEFLEWAVLAGRGDVVDTCAGWIDATVALGDNEREATARNTFAEVSGAELTQAHVHAEFRNLAHHLLRPGAAVRCLLERTRTAGHSDSYLRLVDSSLGPKFSPEALVWTIVSILGDDEGLLPTYLTFAVEACRTHADPSSALAALQHLTRSGLSTEHLVDTHAWALRETGGVPAALSASASEIDTSLDSDAVLEIFEHARRLFDDDEMWCRWCMEQCERAEKDASTAALTSILDVALATKNSQIVVNLASVIERRSAPNAPPIRQVPEILDLFASRPDDDLSLELLEFADRQFARGAAASRALDPFLFDYTRRNPRDERAIHVLMGSRGGDERACIEAIELLCVNAELSPESQGLAWAIGANVVRSAGFARSAADIVVALGAPQGTRAFAMSLRADQQLDALLEVVRRSPWDLALTEPALEIAASHSAYDVELELLKIQLAISASLGDAPMQTSTLTRILHILSMRNERSLEEVDYSERLAFLASEQHDLELAQEQLRRLIDGDLESLASTPPARPVSLRRELARVYVAQGDRFAAARSSIEATDIAVRERLQESRECIEELLPLLPHCPDGFNVLDLLQGASELGFDNVLVASWMYKAAQLGHKRDARALLQRSLEFDPDDEAAALSLEDILRDLEAVDGLHDFFRWRLNRIGVPNTEQETRLVRGYVERLRASLAIHDPSSAENVALLDTLIAISPAHVDARIEQATLQLEAGKIAAAVEGFEVVLAQIPEDDPRGFQAALTVGTSLYETEPTRAAELLLRAHQFDPKAEELAAPLASLASLPLEPSLRLRVVEVLLNHGIMRSDLEWLFLDLLAQTNQMEQLHLHAQTMLLDDLALPLQRNVLELLVVADTAIEASPKLRASHLSALADVLEALGEDPGHIRTQLPALWTAYGAPASEVLDEIEAWLTTTEDPLPYLKGHAMFSLPDEPNRHERVLRRAFMLAEDDEDRARLAYGIAHAAMARDDPDATLRMLERAPPISKTRPEFSDLRLWAVRRLDQVDDEAEMLIVSALQADDPTPIFEQLLRLEEDNIANVFEFLLAALPRAGKSHQIKICVWLLELLLRVPDRQSGLLRGILSAVRRFDISGALLEGWASVHAVLCAQEATPSLDGLISAVQVSLGEDKLPDADLRILAAATLARLTSPDPLVNLAWTASATSDGPLGRADSVAHFLDAIGGYPNIPQGIISRAWERLAELVPRRVVGPLLQELLQQRAQLREPSARALSVLFEQRGDWLSLITLLEFESSYDKRSAEEQVNALEWLARVHGDVFDDPEAAIRRLSRAISLEPDAAHLRVSLFEREIEAGAFEDALDVAERFCVTDEIRGGARDALLRRAADASIVHGDIPRALSLLVQRDQIHLEEDGESPSSLLRSDSSSVAVAQVLEEIAGRQSGALRLRALEALAEKLIHEVGDHAHAARVLCSLIDEQPARVELFERLERCYARSQRWDLLASQLVRMAASQPVVIRRRLLERAAQIQRVRLRNPEEAESILHAAKALPGETSHQLNLELARCKFERRDFAGVVESCRAIVHRVADDIQHAEFATPGMTSTEKAVVQLVSDASQELLGIDHALLDVYESLDLLGALPDHAIQPLAGLFLRSGRYDRFVRLLQHTAREFFAQGEFTSAMALLSQYAVALEVEQGAPRRHVASLHLQTYLCLPEPNNPSKMRARALLSTHTSMREARALVEELIESLDEERAAAGLVLLGDALTQTDPGEARLAYKRAWELDGNSIDARIGLVRLLSSMALFDAALDVAMDVLEENRLTPEMVGEIIVTATDCLERLGRGDEALILLERAFEEVPSHWRLGCLLAEALARAGLYGREHARLRALARRDLPPHQLARVSLRIARLLYSHSDEIEFAEQPTHVEIERHLQRALKLDPELTEARDILVEIKRSSGDIKSMAAIWQEGLRSMAPGSSRASSLLDLCEVHIAEIPSEALRLDYLLRAISERGISPRVLERAEAIVQRIPDTAQVASGLIIAAVNLPPHDRLTQSRVLGLASVAWEAGKDYDAAKLAKRAAQEAISSLPEPSVERTASTTGRFPAASTGADEHGSDEHSSDEHSSDPHDADASASRPVEAWVADLTRKGLANIEERARSLDILEMRELRAGKFGPFVEAIEAAASDAGSGEGLAELRHDALDRLCRYGAPKRHFAPLLRSALASCPGDSEQTSRVLRLLANHTNRLAGVIVELLPNPMRREELLIVLCAELSLSDLSAPLRHAEHIERIELLTTGLEPAEWIRDRLESALSLCIHHYQREMILRGIRGCLRTHDDSTAREQTTNRLVQVLAESGDRERALEECRSALGEAAPGSELERTYLDLAGADPFVLESLMEPLGRSIRVPPSELGSLLLRASHAVRERHADPETALALIERAHALQPDDPEVSALLIEHAFESGEHELAAETAREVARTRGDVDDRLVLGAISEALVTGPSSEVVLVLRARAPTPTRVALLCKAMSQAADQLCAHGPLARLDSIITVASAIADQHDGTLMELFNQWSSLQRCRTAGDYLLRGRLAERSRDADVAFWCYQVAARQRPGGRAEGLSRRLRPKRLPLDNLVNEDLKTSSWCGPLARFISRARAATFGVAAAHQHYEERIDEDGRRAASSVLRLLAQFQVSSTIDIDVSAVEEPLEPGMLALENAAHPRLLVHPDFQRQPGPEQRFRVARVMCAIALGLAPVEDAASMHPVVLLDALATCVQPSRARRHQDSERIFHRLLDNGISAIEIDTTNRRRIIAEIDAWHDCDDDGLLLSSTLEDCLDLAAVLVSGCLDGAFAAFERDRSGDLREDGFHGDALDERVLRLMQGLSLPPL